MDKVRLYLGGHLFEKTGPSLMKLGSSYMTSDRLFFYGLVFLRFKFVLKCYFFYFLLKCYFMCIKLHLEENTL